MHRGGKSWSWSIALGLSVLSVGSSVEALAETASARPVLVTPTVGSESVLEARRAEIQVAVQRALETQGHRVWVGQDLVGQAVIACQTPECIEQALDAADAEFAIVPALWNRGAGETELTLTLLRREGSNINAEGTLGENADATIETLVAQLFTTRAGAAIAGQEPTRDEPARPNAWLAGPVILIGAGTAALIAVGVSAATRSDNQQVNTAAVAAWSAVGTAAIAGGIAWWVVGAKRRRGPQGARRNAPSMALGPNSVDLRLRF